MIFDEEINKTFRFSKKCQSYYEYKISDVKSEWHLFCDQNTISKIKDFLPIKSNFYYLKKMFRKIMSDPLEKEDARIAYLKFERAKRKAIKIQSFLQSEYCRAKEWTKLFHVFRDNQSLTQEEIEGRIDPTRFFNKPDMYYMVDDYPKNANGLFNFWNDYGLIIKNSDSNFRIRDIHYPHVRYPDGMFAYSASGGVMTDEIELNVEVLLREWVYQIFGTNRSLSKEALLSRIQRKSIAASNPIIQFPFYDAMETFNCLVHYKLIQKEADYGNSCYFHYNGHYPLDKENKKYDPSIYVIAFKAEYGESPGPPYINGGKLNKIYDKWRADNNIRFDHEVAYEMRQEKVNKFLQQNDDFKSKVHSAFKNIVASKRPPTYIKNHTLEALGLNFPNEIYYFTPKDESLYYNGGKLLGTHEARDKYILLPYNSEDFENSEVTETKVALSLLDVFLRVLPLEQIKSAQAFIMWVKKNEFNINKGVVRVIEERWDEYIQKRLMGDSSWKRSLQFRKDNDLEPL